MAKLLFYPKIHGARRGVGEEPGVAHTTCRRGLGLAAPTHVVAASADTSRPSFAYKLPLYKKHRGFIVFPERVPLLRRHFKP